VNERNGGYGKCAKTTDGRIGAADVGARQSAEEAGWRPDVAAALAPHVEGSLIQELGEFLETVAYYMKKIQTKEQYDPLPKCIECGKDIEHDLTVYETYRKDVRYCSPRCRQRAYRKRVTENNSNRAKETSQNG
jgi:hypothetical protein